MTDFEKARALLHEFKGNSYLFGTDVLPKVGQVVAAAGKNAALVRDTFSGSDDYVGIIRNSLAESAVNLVAEIKGARPNCPREDLFCQFVGPPDKVLEHNRGLYRPEEADCR